MRSTRPHACMQVDTTGLGVILMDFLIQKEWVCEEDLTNSIRVHNKIIRRALKYLERASLFLPRSLS